MNEIIDAKLVYQSPDIELSIFETEGVLCMSSNIHNWESNDDIL